MEQISAAGSSLSYMQQSRTIFPLQMDIIRLVAERFGIGDLRKGLGAEAMKVLAMAQKV